MKRMLITIVISLWLPQFGLAQGAARTQLNAFANGVKTMTARFEQTVLDVNGKVSDRSAGSLKLQSPRQFRWDILEPYEQHIVADGDHVWVHDVELEQVNVRSQSFDEANSPLAVLLDLGMLDQEFASSETGKRAGTDWLRLKSKAKEPEFQSADLAFVNNKLTQMVLTDNFGQRSEIRFSAWQRNPKLAASEFRFTPPEGVDVVGQVREPAKVTPLNN